MVGPQLRSYNLLMQVTLDIPADLMEHPDPAREALEAYAIAGYRAGALTAYQT